MRYNTACSTHHDGRSPLQRLSGRQNLTNSGVSDFNGLMVSRCLHNIALPSEMYEVAMEV